MALFVAFSHAAKADPERGPRRACLQRFTFFHLPNRDQLRSRPDRNLLAPMRRVVPKLCPEPDLLGESATKIRLDSRKPTPHNCFFDSIYHDEDTISVGC